MFLHFFSAFLVPVRRYTGCAMAEPCGTPAKLWPPAGLGIALRSVPESGSITRLSGEQTGVVYNATVAEIIVGWPEMVPRQFRPPLHRTRSITRQGLDGLVDDTVRPESMRWSFSMKVVHGLRNISTSQKVSISLKLRESN